ncbi:MAG: hypothetical protein K2N42_02685, partial [Anaeroplasmataceae bacterium]|nr:hypothetical protein [Anaeroplasmataceae bacterium]
DFERFIRNEISDALDALSFYDDDSEYNLDRFIESFKSLDLLLQQTDKWEGYYTEGEYDMWCVLFLNKADKQYVILTDYFEEQFPNNGLKFVNNDEYEKLKDSLSELKYEELNYFSSSEE